MSHQWKKFKRISSKHSFKNKETFFYYLLKLFFEEIPTKDSGIQMLYVGA
jgi:hypothetical protein